MLKTKRNTVLASAGLLIATLMSPAGAADGWGETPQMSEQPAAAATYAARAAARDADPDGSATRFERLSEWELKNVYRRCNEEALANRLATTEIGRCSVAYEVLLKRHFHGDFEALLAWSRGS